jgi:hypothetical protein
MRGTQNHSGLAAGINSPARTTESARAAARCQPQALQVTCRKTPPVHTAADRLFRQDFEPRGARRAK